ncbi:MAG: hypothetical protein NTY47_01450 [Candidatus Omnitrophica bacterium]|nr:hypothetical protein [Candidatus Omnitrophota bacterium]
MNIKHTECIEKLIEIGSLLGFEALPKVKGKMYELANPDCVWYYKGKGASELRKIAKGDGYKYIPFIAFEVAFSEKEKNLRGSLVSLQLANAAASIIVLLGTSAELKPKLKKLFGRYSSTRFRIWSEKDVDGLYKKVKVRYS